MTAYLALQPPTGVFSCYDLHGAPLSGGLVYTALPGTAAGPFQAYPKATYTSASMAASNTNPVVLGSTGQGAIFLNGFYSVAICDANGVLLYTADNVVGGIVSGTCTILSIIPGASSVAGAY